MSALLTKREVAELAGRSERWVEQKREELGAVEVGTARNGRADTRYNLASLPADVQRAWAERQRVVEMPAAQPGQLALALTMPVGPNLSEADRAEAERRFRAIEWLVDADKYRLLYAEHGSKGAAVAWLCSQFGIKPRTVYDWVARWKKGGLRGLVDSDRADKGKPKALKGATLDFLLAASMPRKGVYGVLSVREIYRELGEEREWRAAHAGKVLGEFDLAKYARYVDEDGKLRESAQLDACSYETVRTWFNRIPEVARVMARQGGEAYRNTQEILSWRELTAVDPLDYVVMDHRVLDIFCLVPERGKGWRLARPWLTAAIDMRTRKWLGWCFVESPSSDSIATVLKQVFIDHGLPKALYWDNGKDFRCEWLEGKSARARKAEKIGEIGTAWRGVLGTLQVHVHHAIVKNARAKIIEPNFGRISKFDETMPEFCGHKPTQRPERFAELVKQHEAWAAGRAERSPFRTIAEIAAIYSDAIDVINEQPMDPGAEGMRKVTPTGYGWMCPNEAWELLIPRVARRTVEADVLQFCFAKRRELTVKHGEVKTSFAGRDYHYRMSGNAIALMALNGQTVEFAYDPLDLGEAAIYYQSRFVGMANCVELRRMGESAFEQDERDRRASRREVKKFIEAVHVAVPIAGPEERLARRKAVLPARGSEARVAVPVEIAPAVREAEAAARADREQGFLPEALEVEERPAAADGDDEFKFFGD